MGITREEFELLWRIFYQGKTDPGKASDGSDEDMKDKTALFLTLGRKGLVRIESRDGDEVYGAMLTESGRKVLADKKYENWIPEWDRH